MFKKKDNDLTQVSKIQLRLDDALDRLEIYFKKREEILKNEELSKIEKIEKINEVRKKYASSLKIKDMIKF